MQEAVGDLAQAFDFQGQARHPTGCLQLIRVCAADGTSIATGIVLGMGHTAYFWGGASWRQHQRLRPNEALFWYAFTTWKRRGACEFDFGGGGEYKRKYGAADLLVPHARWSKWPALESLRATARQMAVARQRVAGLVAAAPQAPALVDADDGGAIPSGSRRRRS